MRPLLQRAPLALLAILLVGPVSLGQSSQWVRYGQSGRLLYQMDHRGDRLLDYSSAGYQRGAPLPDVGSLVPSNRVVNVAPIPGDNRARIQAAIDLVAGMPLNAAGFRGVVQLASGQFDISDTLRIGVSGVILRGVGDDASPASNTILRSTSTQQINLIEVGNFDQYANNLFRQGSSVGILDEVVPAGATSFRVADPAGYAVGDWINVKRTPTQAWFDYVTSHFADDPSGENLGWNLSENRFTFQQERRVTRIEGDRVFIDAPLSASIDPRSNGTIEHYNDRRVSHVGIESIRGDSVFNANETGVYSGRTQFDDEDHANTFVQFSHAEESWARDVTGRHLKSSAVSVGIVSRSITVEDARFIDPVSVVTGGRRYGFNITGSLSLMRDLEADSARRAFINNTTFNGFNRGPNVFFNGVSTNAFTRSGPHTTYSTGALYDNLDDDGGFEARRSSRDGTHGWRGAHTVLWNSNSSEFQIASPPGANNYLIGATGDSSSPDPTGAIIDSFGTRVTFNDPENPLDSLYLAQKLEEQRFAGEASREYWVGDFDELQPGDAADTPPIDADWLTAIGSLSDPFHSTQAIAAFDEDAFGRRVPFTIEYELAEDEQVNSAVLTLGMKRRGGASSDDDLLWLDQTEAPLSFAPGEWGPIFEGGLQVLTLELVGDLDYLQDGQLNGVLSNNRAIDWAHLIVNVGPATGLAGDFNEDGRVDAADYTVWRDSQGSAGDYSEWRAHYGATSSSTLATPTPEPRAFGLTLIAGLVTALRRRGGG
ncbi:hypothetical protein MalM25_11050 [Planctomycetes bacterium MalM25]|nr:hypothetical protein MalM25_11050 [Planctomycetes bacterium MalM25]